MEDSVLFNMDVGLFSEHSEAAGAIFSLQSGEGTEEDPIHAPGMTVEEFSGFVKWMKHM